MGSRRGIFRGIYSALPDDLDFQQLSSQARLVLLVARICRDVGPGAIFRYYPNTLAAQTGLTIPRLMHALTELEDHGWVVHESPVLWIKNGLRYDPWFSLANWKHRLSIQRWVAGLPHQAIVLKYCDYYQLPYPFDSHSILGEGSRRVGSREVGTTDSKSEALFASAKIAESNGLPPKNLTIQAQEILEFLNAKTGRTFRPSPVTLALIVARLKSGATVANCRGVIARKVREWGTDPKMAPYLRPKTLFNATNFENYLGERAPDTPHASV